VWLRLAATYRPPSRAVPALTERAGYTDSRGNVTAVEGTGHS
jgi:hypothetical protein